MIAIILSRSHTIVIFYFSTEIEIHYWYGIFDRNPDQIFSYLIIILFYPFDTDAKTFRNYFPAADSWVICISISLTIATLLVVTCNYY